MTYQWGRIVIHQLDKRWGHRRPISVIPPNMTRSEFDANPDGWQFQIGEVWRPRWRDADGRLWEDTSPGAGWNYEFRDGNIGWPAFPLDEEKGWCRTLAEVRSIPQLRDAGQRTGPGFQVGGDAYRG